MIFLVTGASAGFGAAITRRLVQDGHRVIATARRLDKLQTLAAGLGGGSNVLNNCSAKGRMGLLSFVDGMQLL